MEIESKNGFKTLLQKTSETFDLGRELGFDSTDRTVSRHHISFKLHEDRARVCFEAKGKNPVWVHDSIDDQIRVYRRSEGGEMKSGDSFCVSSKNPIWFNLKKIGSEDDDKLESELRFDDELAEASGSGIDYDEIEIDDISHMDPVKEFNFVVMGHEFDCYPKNMIRDIRSWDWFLDEPNEKSDDDDEDDNDRERKAKKDTKKRKKGRGKDDDEDDVWTCESEEDAETIKKLKNVPKPKYSTRSKNQKKNKKTASASKSAKFAENDEDDDDDDETLGGFIVDDDETRGEEDNEDDEEEEEFEEDEYDDE